MPLLSDSEQGLKKFLDGPSMDYKKYAEEAATEIAANLRAMSHTSNVDYSNIEGYDHQTLINMINRTLQGAMNEERYYIVKKMLDNTIDNLKHVLSLLNSADAPYAKRLYKSLLNHQQLIDLEFKKMIQTRAAAALTLDIDLSKRNIVGYDSTSQAGSGISQEGGKRTKYRRKNTRKSKRQGKSNKRQRGKSNKRRRSKSKRRH